MAKTLGADSAPTRETFKPDLGKRDFGHEYPQIDVLPPFVYVYSPKRWIFLDGDVLPLLHQHALEPGINGIDVDGNGKWLLAAFSLRLEREGRTLIPFEWGPDGSYVAKVRTRTPAGTVVDSFISAFSNTHPGDNKIEPDVKAYADWLRGLIKSKKLPACPPYKLREILSNREGLLQEAKVQLEKKSTANRVQRVELLEAEVTALAKKVKALDKTKRPTAAKTPDAPSIEV